MITRKHWRMGTETAWSWIVRDCRLPWAWLVTAGMTLLLVLPSRAQESRLQELLFGSIYPLSTKLKDFGSDWRQITIRGNATVTGNVAVNVSGNSSSATSQNNITGALTGTQIYLTKGQTTLASGRIYLVAYHLPSSGLDFGMLLQALATKSPPTAAALTPETPLPLALLDLQSVGSLDDIRLFDLDSEITRSEKAVQMLGELMKSQAGGNSGKTNAAPTPPKSDQ